MVTRTATSQVLSNTLDGVAVVAMLEQAPLMACGVVGVQHCKRAPLSHLLFSVCESGAAPQTGIVYKRSLSLPAN